MSRLTLIFNTHCGKRSIYDLFLSEAPVTEQDLMDLPLVQLSSVVRFLGDVETCLKHKHVSILVNHLPPVYKLVSKCDLPHIPLIKPSLLQAFAVASQWCESMLRSEGKILSIRKAKRVIEKYWLSEAVLPPVLQLVRVVFRQPLPNHIEPLAVFDYLHTKVQPQNQVTPKQVLEVLESMAKKHPRARLLFAFTARWARERLPDQPLFACIPDSDSLWNLLSIYMNGNCNLRDILNSQ